MIFSSSILLGISKFCLANDLLIHYLCRYFKKCAMKRLISVILAVLVMQCAWAQKGQHMKFMGIPMGVSITSFHQKLINKGLSYDQRASRRLPAGSRTYTGSFAGYQADFYVYNDVKSKLVYRAKAIIDRSELSKAEQIYDELLNMLAQKYDDSYFSDASDTYKCCMIFTNHGRIDLYISKFDADYIRYINDYYVVSVDYYDAASSKAHDGNRMDDL